MNQHHPPREPWTTKEIALLTKHYPDLNNEDLVCLFNNRSAHAIAHKASKLSLRKSEKFLNSTKSGRILASPNCLVRLAKWFRTWYS